MTSSVDKKRPRKTPLPDTPLTTVALWFRAKRESLGMTQAQFANYVGLPPALVSDLERGATDVRLSNLLRALEVLSGELIVKDRPRVYDIESLLKEEDSNGRN